MKPAKYYLYTFMVTGESTVRNLKKIVVIALLLILFGCGPQTASNYYTMFDKDDPRIEKMGKTKGLDTANWFDMSFIGNWYMDTRLFYILGGVYNGLGDISEILDTATRIRHTSEISWYDQWIATAERVEMAAKTAEAGGHRISAGEAWLRSAQYFLAAEVFLHTNPDDERILPTYKHGAANFIQAMKLLGVNAKEIRIPFEGTTLRGYLFRPEASTAPAPILVAHQGFDAPIESTWGLAEAAMKRGWNCILFEGPGQGLVLREQHLVFRHDWEKPVRAVIDYVYTLGSVDKTRIILEGISMGGGFAARAAAYEHRPHTVVLNPGYVNIRDMFIDMFSEKLLNMQEDDPAAFDEKILEMAKYDVGFRWGIHHAMMVFGASGPSRLFELLTQYDYRSDIPKINAQVLVVVAEDEEYGIGQSEKVMDLLSTKKKQILQFSRSEAASLHCQTGSPAIGYARLFDWLDDNVK